MNEEENYILPLDPEFESKGDFFKYYNELKELRVDCELIDPTEPFSISHDLAIGLLRTIQTLEKKVQSFIRD